MRPTLLLLLLFYSHLVCCIPPPPSSSEYFRSTKSLEQPPHCTNTPYHVAKESKGSKDALELDDLMQFSIGLHTTICFRLDENLDNSTDEKSSWLHTIRLESIQHHHPVTQKYVFAIPEVSVNCMCECDANSATCTPFSHKYTECPQSQLQHYAETCYRTFYPNQASTGCSSDSNPKLCCELKFQPYKGKSYTAVKVEQPTTFATFVYAAYDYAGGKWILKDYSLKKTQLDGGPQHHSIDYFRRIELSISAAGRVSHQLESGMYYAESNSGGEMDALRQQPLNEITDTNYDRLGWYREREDGKFHASNAQVRLEKVHSAKVINCKEQTFKSILDANFYMPGNFNSSPPVEEVHPWIERARLVDGKARSVIVNHAEGTNLQISLKVKNVGNGNQVFFVHNTSRIDDFSGSIIVDSRSNRYLNVSVEGASGRLSGTVLSSASPFSPPIHSFTTYVHELSASNRTLLISLPAFLEEGDRMVCLRGDEAPANTTICKVLPYHEIPLEVDIEHSTWRELIGYCPDCNKVGINGIVKFLNPLNWVDGASSAGDYLSMATDVFVYVCVLAVVYIVVTKLVIPIFQCWVCPLYIMRKRKSAEKEKKKQKDYSMPGTYV